MNSPRRLVESSMSEPMYWLGVTRLSLTQGSSMASISPGFGQQGRVVDDDLATAVGQLHVVFDGRRRRDEVEAELALEPLLDDLHVEQAEEPAAEAEAERDRALRRVGEARVVEVELLERVAEQRVVLAADRVDAREDEALGLLVAGQRLVGGAGDGRDRVADLGVADALEARRDVADLARHEPVDRHELRPEDAEFERVGLGAAGHQPDRLVAPGACPRRAGRRRRRPCRRRSGCRR